MINLRNHQVKILLAEFFWHAKDHVKVIFIETQTHLVCLKSLEEFEQSTGKAII
jgi:hypothetical protein